MTHPLVTQSPTELLVSTICAIGGARFISLQRQPGDSLVVYFSAHAMRDSLVFSLPVQRFSAYEVCKCLQSLEREAR